MLSFLEINLIGAAMTATKWQYLESRPSSWRQQLYFKGRKLTAFAVWSDMIVNDETPQEAAINWDLPLDAINEAIEYCSNNLELINKEALEERYYLEERGILLEPKITH